MGIALHRAKLGEITWEEYGRVVAKQMEVKNGPARDGTNWQDYGWHKAMKAKSAEKGKGKGKGKGKSKSKRK